MSFSLYIREKIRVLYVKMIREKASPEYIARGWAIGMFWGLAMPLGAQLIFSIPCSFLFRGSKIGAVFGTMMTNPVTIFVIYPTQYWIGSRILGGPHTLHEWSVEALLDLKWDVITPFFVGGSLLGLVLAIPTYYGVLALVKRHRLRKRRKHADNADKTDLHR